MIEKDPSVKRFTISIEGYFDWSRHITAVAGVSALVALAKQGIISPRVAIDAFSSALSSAVSELDRKMVSQQLRGEDYRVFLKTEESFSEDELSLKYLEQSTLDRVKVSMNRAMGQPNLEEDYKKNG